jgi:hypothetical protein
MPARVTHSAWASTEPGNPRSGTVVVEPSGRVGYSEHGSMTRPAAMSGLRETDGEPVRPQSGEKDLSTRRSASKASGPLSQRLQTGLVQSLWRRKRVRRKLKDDQISRVSPSV